MRERAGNLHWVRRIGIREVTSTLGVAVKLLDHCGGTVLAMLGRSCSGSLADLTIKAERWLGADPDHLLTVSSISAAIAEALRWTPQPVRRIRLASMMHDIGFASMPWTRTEIESRGDLPLDVTEQHTLIGAELLSSSKSHTMNMAGVIAQAHHERWDGYGYPHGLCGHAIPQTARIVAVAEAIDRALASNIDDPPERLSEHLCREAGEIYDRELVKLVVSRPDITANCPGHDAVTRRWRHVAERFRRHHPRLVTRPWLGSQHRNPNRVY